MAFFCVFVLVLVHTYSLLTKEREIKTEHVQAWLHEVVFHTCSYNLNLLAIREANKSIILS